MSKNVNKSIAKIEKKLREIDTGKWSCTSTDKVKLMLSLKDLKEQRDANK